jgi:uncharacterized membrane protein
VANRDRSRMDFLSATISVMIRVVPLIFYTGGYLFLFLVLRPKVSSVPPAQQIVVVTGILKRFSKITWGLIALMFSGGVTYAFFAGILTFDLSSILRSTTGLLIGLDFLLTVFMVASALVMSLWLVPRLERINVSVTASPLDARFRWLVVEDRARTDKGRLRQMVAIATLNSALGMASILLGLIVAAAPG